MDLNKLFRTQWDRTTAVILSAVGLLFLLFGYIGVSGTPYLAGQAPYILSGGIGGVFFLGFAATLWISADLRDEWRKLDRIEAALENGVLRWTAEDDVQALGQSAPQPLAVTSEPVHLPAQTHADDIDLLTDTIDIPTVVTGRSTRAGATRRTNTTRAATTTRASTTASTTARTTKPVKASTVKASTGKAATGKAKPSGTVRGS